VRRFYANFTYQTGSWTHPRRVIAKVEWHPGELYPRVGFIVTSMAHPAKNVVAFYNKRGTCEQWIKEGKGAIKWTRLSCRTFAANAVRLQLHALAYNLGNFLRTLATPEPINGRSHHQRQREALDCHAFTSNRQEECAQMPGKMARSAPLTTVRAARCEGGRLHLAAVLQEGRKYANIHARSGVIWGIPVHSRQSSTYWGLSTRSAPSR
jgi:hypothetical protein